MGILYRLSFPGGKSYIGITRESLESRVRRHISYARSGKSLALSCAIRKYGEDSFSAEVVAYADEWSSLQAMEIAAIAAAKASGEVLYNMTGGGDGSLGVALSDQTKQKISSSLRGRKQGFSDAHRRRLSEVQKGKVIPPDVREKMRRAAIGRIISDEQREKVRAALKGRKIPSDVIAKRLASRYGDQRRPSSTNCCSVEQ